MTLFSAWTGSIDLGEDGSITDSSLIELVGGGKTATGVKVTEARSLTMPAVWRAVTLLAGSIAGLPIHAYRQEGDTRVRAGSSSQSTRVLSDPHPDLTVFEWLELVVAHLALWGNAYLLIQRDGFGRVLYLLPIHPSQVQVGRRKSDRAKRYAITGPLPDGSNARTLGDLDVLHIPGFGYDGICGVSPIRAARQGVALALAAEEFGGKLFGSGSLATGILQTEQRLTQGQADKLSDRWNEKRSGLKSAHGTIVLDKGVKFTQLTIPPEDAQFLESRSFQVSEIARMFGIPPHMLSDTEKSTSWGTGIEQQTIGFVTYTLRPWLARIEQRLTRLLRPDTVYVRFSLEGLLRGDSGQRSSFYKALWDLGALSTNEIRAYEDLGPVEGGDVRYRPLNMGELGSTDTPDNPPDPTGGPDAP
ncbi:phage portal protein [Nocardioides sp. 503]|uniref:phage portal protein n=1 Tax=Nocardioides sp. 503 TaxID=2508326 RepID=UPI001ADA2698|nr:phage portal protein [Nocardioides sp. 503]